MRRALLVCLLAFGAACGGGGDDEPASELSGADRERVCSLVADMTAAKESALPLVPWDEPGGSMDGTYASLESTIAAMTVQADALEAIANYANGDARQGARDLAESSRSWAADGQVALDEARSENRSYFGSVALVGSEHAPAVMQLLDSECGASSNEWFLESTK